eukprot:1154277-Prorocentrum_lima.AAC.1
MAPTSHGGDCPPRHPFGRVSHVAWRSSLGLSGMSTTEHEALVLGQFCASRIVRPPARDHRHATA